MSVERIVPKTTHELSLTPKDQRDVIEYIKNVEDRPLCDKLQDNMSTKAITFAIDVIQAFVE